MVSLAAAGFSGFTTDAYADVFFPPIVSRSADGDRITSVDGGEGDAGLLIRTDATAYALDESRAAFTAMVRFQGNAGGSPDQVATLPPSARSPSRPPPPCRLSPRPSRCDAAVPAGKPEAGRYNAAPENRP